MLCFGRTVVNVMGCQLGDRGSSHSQGKSFIRYALHDIQFISDESSVDLVLHLCE